MARKTKERPDVPNGSKPSPWKNRIVGYGDVDPSSLLANPKNWRIHPEAQQEALSAVLDVVGWVQVAAIVNKRTGFVVDGHLRVSLALQRKEPTIPVGYVDLTNEEEDLVLASFDPISNAAVVDSALLNSLLADIDISNPALDNLFAGLLNEGERTTFKDVESDSDSSERHLGEKHAQIKPVLYAEEIATFESALRATGQKNRGKALMEVCRFYLNEKTGQLDSQLQDVLAG